MEVLRCRRPGGTLADEDFETITVALEEGKLVVFPTETLYGIGGDPENQLAAERIYKLKRKPRSQPLSIALSSWEQIRRIAEVGTQARALFDEFLPGPLTLILRKRNPESFGLVAEGDTIGIRIPSHPLVGEVVEHFGPITATSANVTGSENTTTVDGAIDQLGSGVDYYIDGGRTQLGVPSTIVDLSQGEIRVLREGAIPTERIEPYG